MSDSPRAGLTLLVDTGLAEVFLPELPALQLEVDEHHHHKDVYQHSLTVLEQAIGLEGPRSVPGVSAPETVEGPDLVLRLAALLHDVGKPATRRFEPAGGVSFHHHEVVGAKLVAKRLEGAAVRQGDDRGGREAGRAAPAVPRVRHGGVDRLGGPALRHRCGTAAAAAAPADPVRLARRATPARPSGWRGPTTTSRPGSRRSRPPRSWRRSGPSWTATRSARSSACRPGG